MKKIISTTLLFITFLTGILSAQQIPLTNYNKQFIHEDFNQEGDHFEIANTTDNYFIIDKGDYLLSRNNNESEYAIIANKSSVTNFILKTAIRLGPTKNKKASIGIILKAQENGKGAIIFEINKKGKYRIKQQLSNTYKILSGKSKNEGWVKSKSINKVNEHNFIEIITENNIYEVYMNSKYLTTFYVADYTNGSCGLIISAETKARVSYYYINTKGNNTTATTSYAHKNSNNTNTSTEKLNKEIATHELNNTKIDSLNTGSRENQEGELESLRKKNNDQAAVSAEQEKEIISLKYSIRDLKSKSTSTNLTNKQLTENIDALNQQVTIEKSLSGSLINDLNNEIIKLTNEVNNLKDQRNIRTTITTNLTTDLSTEKIAHNKTKNDLSKSESNKITVIKTLEAQLKTTKQQLKSETTSLTNDLNKVSKSSNSKIKKLTNEVSTLKTQINTTTNKNKNLSTDFSAEKIAHNKTKNDLSKSITNKIIEIKELEAKLNTNKEKLKSANKNGDLAIKCAKKAAILTTELKNANQEIIILENIKNKHNNIVNELNIKLSLLKAKQLELDNKVQALNKKTSNLETTNIELKELFILKDFEVNGIKPSKLTKQAKTYPVPKEIKGTSTIYSVQFGVFMQAQGHSTLEGLDDVWYETTELGTYVYFSGEFKDPQEATLHKNKVIALGYPNAFLVTLTK
tara:strand:+ start:974 stop:3040 length:2067 start_codon:yes stop_codon:yes gene_type:complete